MGLTKSTNITPHLVFDNAADAIEFYKKAFGAVELMRMPGPDGRLMHAAVKIGDSELMMCDAFPEYGGSPSPKTLGNSPVTIHINTPDVDAMFNAAVKAGATVSMPVDNMFWGDRYGKLVDPFGHHWSIATRIEDLSPAQMKERGDKAFGDFKNMDECATAGKS